MSNEPTPDTPDADDSVSTPADPSATESSGPPPADEADPTVDVMSDFTSADGDDEDADQPGEEPADNPADSYVPPEPPPYAMVPPVRRLVRDPYSRLGGVCSGIAHHTGVDVSLVRLGFVLATLFSGIGLILYLLAWMIVPRAEYWPPAPYEAGTNGGSLLQGRQLAYGLLAIGIILVIFSGAGGFARMLVSVGLVGAGLYLLIQPQSATNSSASGADGGSMPPVPPTPGTAPTAPPSPDSTATAGTESVPTTWQPAPGNVGPDPTGDELASPLPGQVQTESFTTGSSAAAVPPASVKTVYVPSPVPPRRRRIWPFLLIIGLLLIPVAAVIGGIAFVVGSGEEFSEADVVITPATAAEIPGRIDEGAGTITLDLSNLDVEDFADTAGAPQEVEIDLNAGEVTVDLPRDFPVTVDASASAGEITVLDRYEDGIRPRITVEDDDAVLAFDIRIGVGSISVDG